MLKTISETIAKLETHEVYRKPKNAGLLLHFQSHTDERYKDSSLKTMIQRAYALSFRTEAFNAELNVLSYALYLVALTISPTSFIDSTANIFLS